MDRHGRRPTRRSARAGRSGRGRPAGHGGHQDESSAATLPARRSPPRRLPTVATLVVVLTAGWVADAAGWDLRLLQDLLRPRAYVQVDGRAVAVPRPEPATGRLLPPVPVTTSGEHAFLHTTPEGDPVGYDPCRAVRYVVRPDGAPDGAAELVREAARMVSEASGLALVPAGTTDEEPAMARALVQPRYGPAWAPVLLAWSDEDEMPELAGQVAGVGGSAAVPGSSGQGRWLAAGRVVLDGPDLAAILERRDGHARARAIVVHELAHVLGLDHVDDPTELMHPMTANRVDLGPGDRQGLARLGQVPCEE